MRIESVDANASSVGGTIVQKCERMSSALRVRVRVSSWASRGSKCAAICISFMNPQNKAASVNKVLHPRRCWTPFATNLSPEASVRYYTSPPALFTSSSTGVTFCRPATSRTSGRRHCRHRHHHRGARVAGGGAKLTRTNSTLEATRAASRTRGTRPVAAVPLCASLPPPLLLSHALLVCAARA